MIDIVASSDFHGYLPEITKPFDLMLLAGDLEPARNHFHYYQKEWYIEEFVPWVLNLPFKNPWSKVIFTSGNHSIYLSQEGDESPSVYSNIIAPCKGRTVYLHNQEYTFEYLDENEGIKEITIFGTPYCKIFGNWWNMLSDEKLKEKYSEIPDNCDILLSHDVPYGLCDKCLGWQDWGRTPEHIGNKVLREAIESKKPILNICGHLHTGDHHFQEADNGTLVRQVSYLNEQYIPTFKPFYFTWPIKLVVPGGDLQ